jgi:hypothetical protein
VLARACWALALLTELYRIGLRPDSPLARLPARAVSAEQLMALAPPKTVAEFLDLRGHAEQVLLPALAVGGGAWAIGPTFSGSQIMNADADLVAAGLLFGAEDESGGQAPRRHPAAVPAADRSVAARRLRATERAPTSAGRAFDTTASWSAWYGSVDTVLDPDGGGCPARTWERAKLS